MNINSKSHPLWGFLEFCVVIILLSTVLMTNAENFDITEIKSISQFFFGLLMAKGGVVGLKKIFLKEKDEDDK